MVPYDQFSNLLLLVHVTRCQFKCQSDSFPVHMRYTCYAWRYT
ncbi:MAG: hypothetical protein ABSB74_15100 [Tepidisphaeraceae bacterium]